MLLKENCFMAVVFKEVQENYVQVLVWWVLRASEWVECRFIFHSLTACENQSTAFHRVSFV